MARGQAEGRLIEVGESGDYPSDVSGTSTLTREQVRADYPKAKAEKRLPPTGDH